MKNRERETRWVIRFDALLSLKPELKQSAITCLCICALIAPAKFSRLLLPLRSGALALFRRVVAALSNPAAERFGIVQVGSQGQHHQIPDDQGK